MLNIYITDLAAYNKSLLHGRWVQLPMDRRKLKELITQILQSGEEICAQTYGYEMHEELFISDWYWDSYEFYNIDEYDDIFKLNEDLQQLEYKNDHDLKCVEFLLQEDLATDIADALSKVDDVVIFENFSMSDVAYHLLQEIYNVDELPSIIANNIDYERVAKEIEFDACYFDRGSDIYEYRI